MKKFIFLFSCLFSLLIGNGMAMEVEGKEAKTPEQKTKEAAAAPMEWPETAFLEDLIKSDTNSSSSSVAASTSSMEATSSSSSSSVSQNNLNPLTKCLLKRAIQKYKKYAIALNAETANVVEKEEKESLHNYSINLIWMTRNAKQTYIFPNKRQRSELNPRELLNDDAEAKQAEDEAQIHPSTDEEKADLTIGMKNTFLQSAIQWGLANPGVTVNIWYDSAFVTKEAVENTQKLINDTWGKFSKGKNPITLQDIRELNTVKENPRIFPDKLPITIPIFYQVDLLRIVIALHLLSQQPTTQPYYFVYADLDVLPVPRKNLFDAETVTSLKDAGMALAPGPENYFQIISNNKDLLKALAFAFVELNIQRAMYLIKSNLLVYYDKDYNEPLARLGEAPFKSYDNMFHYFHYLQGKEKLKVIDYKKNTVHDYDKDVDGLVPFNIEGYTAYSSSWLQFEATPNVRPTKIIFGGHRNKLGYGH
jgi:hypothetical protein